MRLSVSVSIAAVVVATAAAAAPARWKPWVENTSRFDLTRVKLTQIAPDEPAFVVTSSGGDVFDKAAIQNSETGPWRFRAEYQCPDGGGSLSSPTEVFTLPGELSSVTLKAIENIDLEDWFAGDVVQGSSAYAGAYEADIWTGSDFSEGHENIEEQFALDACNAALAEIRAENPNMSAKVAMSRIGTIEPFWSGPGAEHKAAKVSFEAVCTQMTSAVPANGPRWYKEVAHRGATETLRPRLKVACKSPLRTPRPAADSLTAGFAVTEATLVAHPTFVKGECPRSIGFRGSFLASGAGEVRYRIRGSDGALGPVNEIQVSSAGRTVFDFTREFGKASTGGLAPQPPAGEPSPGPRIAPPSGGGDPKQPGLAAPGGSGGSGGGGAGAAAGGGSVAAAKGEGEHSGWMRVEILSPGGVTRSREAFYKVICEKPPPALPAGIKVERPPRN